MCISLSTQLLCWQYTYIHPDIPWLVQWDQSQHDPRVILHWLTWQGDNQLTPYWFVNTACMFLLSPPLIDASLANNLDHVSCWLVCWLRSVQVDVMNSCWCPSTPPQIEGHVCQIPNHSLMRVLFNDWNYVDISKVVVRTFQVSCSEVEFCQWVIPSF